MSYTQLGQEERYQIYVLKKAGHIQAEIAAILGRSAPDSTHRGSAPRLAARSRHRDGPLGFLATPCQGQTVGLLSAIIFQAPIPAKFALIVPGPRPNFWLEGLK